MKEFLRAALESVSVVQSGETVVFRRISGRGKLIFHLIHSLGFPDIFLSQAGYHLQKRRQFRNFTVIFPDAAFAPKYPQDSFADFLKVREHIFLYIKTYDQNGHYGYHSDRG